MSEQSTQNAALSTHTDAANCEFFTNKRGIKLHRRYWLHKSAALDAPPRALIFYCHGYQSHVDADFERLLGDTFAQLDCLVVGHDHVGHGRSEADPHTGMKRFQVGKFEWWADDVIDHLQRLISGQLVCTHAETAGSEPKSVAIPADTPIFLYGYSLGAPISIQTVCALLRRHQQNDVTGAAAQPCAPLRVRGLLLESPYLDPGLPALLLRTVLPLLGSLLPNTAARARLPESVLCWTQSELERRRADPLLGRSATTFSTAALLTRAALDIQSRFSELPADELGTPEQNLDGGDEKRGGSTRVASSSLSSTSPFSLLVMQGDADQISPQRGAKLLLQHAANCADKKLHVFPEGRHLLRVDFNREMNELLRDWLSARI